MIWKHQFLLAYKSYYACFPHTMKMCNFQADSSVFSGRLLSHCAREFAHDVNLVLEQSDSIELLLKDLAMEHLLLLIYNLFVKSEPLGTTSFCACERSCEECGCSRFFHDPSPLVTAIMETFLTHLCLQQQQLWLRSCNESFLHLLFAAAAAAAGSFFAAVQPIETRA